MQPARSEHKATKAVAREQRDVGSVLTEAKRAVREKDIKRAVGEKDKRGAARKMSWEEEGVDDLGSMSDYELGEFHIKTELLAL